MGRTKRRPPGVRTICFSAAVGECTQAVCAPEREGPDALGCVVGPPPGDQDGQADCGEDGDPCTDDVCRAAVCAHVEGPEGSRPWRAG